MRDRSEHSVFNAVRVGKPDNRRVEFLRQFFRPCAKGQPHMLAGDVVGLVGFTAMNVTDSSFQVGFRIIDRCSDCGRAIV